MPEQRGERLPQWAQRDRLRRDLEHCRNILVRVNSGDTDVWLCDYLRGHRPLPPRSGVRFDVANGQIDVRPEDHGLRVLVPNGRLSVRPSSSNIVLLRVEPYDAP